jgi:hypothetical protein
MFNFQHLSDFLNASIIVVSLIAFIDILILFKRPLILKFLFLVLIFCIGVYAFGGLFTNHYYYVRFLTETPIQIGAMAMINFFYQLYQNKWSKFVLFSCLFLLFMIFALPIYFSYTFSLDSITTNFYENPNTKNLIIFARIFFIIYFLSCCLYILIKIKNTFYQQNIYYNELRSWCTKWVIISILSIVVGVCKFLYPNFTFFYFSSLILTYLSPLILFIYRPAFLNKIPIRISILNIFTNKVAEDISEENFLHYFFTNLYYLKEKANASDFSELINSNQDIINEFIRIKYNMSFTELVNKYRILYFIELVGKTESKLVTIEALAKDCGFSSRQSMAKYFKKFHGGNPSDLINLII